MRDPATQEELVKLQDECLSLGEHIRSTPSLGAEVPESVWHFLSDSDIRFKDPAYAKAQLVGFEHALVRWEHEIPSNFSFKPTC